jgi:cell wall assembly regulator SMI1
MTVTESFEIIVSRQKELGYYFPYILQPPASIDDIKRTEQALGFKLSPELIELYCFANGTSRDENPLGMIGLIPIHIFMNLEEAEEYYNHHIPFEDSFITWDTNYKPGKQLFPFLQDSSGNCYWVDLNEGTENYNRIYWTNSYPDSPAYTFSSLTAMFETIAECYATNIFFLDEDGHLDKDYDQWGLICKKHNPEIQFWNDYNNGT